MFERNPDDLKTLYIRLFGKRLTLVFREGKYVGWFKSR